MGMTEGGRYFPSTEEVVNRITVHQVLDRMVGRNHNSKYRCPKCGGGSNMEVTMEVDIWKHSLWQCLDCENKWLVRK
jgi:ribosomal protein L37AE/L43A